MPPVAVDVWAEMALKSVARFLSGILVPLGYTGVWISSPALELDRMPDPPGKRDRDPPHVLIVVDHDSILPYEIGNLTISRRARCELWVVCEDLMSYFRRPAQVCQVLNTAADGLDELHESIPLIDFSQLGEPVVGRVEARAGREIMPLVSRLPPEKKSYKTMELTGVASLVVEAEKTREGAIL